MKLNLDWIYVPIAVVCLAVAAQLIIKLPEGMSVAPITGQSLAVIMIAELMDWKKGSITILLYLLLGAIGLPFFAEFSSGWDNLSGKAMGYFIGFLLSVAIIGKWSDGASPTMGPTALRLFLATLIILLCGWLGLLRFLDGTTAFQKGILPFLPGALLKFVLALILIALVRRFMRLMQSIKS